MAFLIKLIQTTGLNRSCFSLFKIKKQKQKTGWAVVVHAFNLSAWEAEAGRFLWADKAQCSSILWIQNKVKSICKLFLIIPLMWRMG